MKKLFDIVPQDFFKPLTSKYKEQWVDCILTIYNSYSSEISYGVDRELIVDVLTDYFNEHTEVFFNEESYFDSDEQINRDSRSKAQGTINYLKACGWVDIEDGKNYQQNVVLTGQAVPFIRVMIEVIKNEETEYQGLISQIHAVLQNDELYSKPYQFILKNVKANTEQLVSSLKKLSISIKKHIDEQTKKKDLVSILDLFASYNQEIVSKSLYRLKTSENVARFRQSIKRNLDKMRADTDVMNNLVSGYMEIEQENNRETAYEKIVEIIVDVKTAFESLDRIIGDIDRKNNFYMKNAAARAKFELASGSNQESKINKILRYICENHDYISLEEREELPPELKDLFSVFTQKYISEESLKKVVEKKTYDQVAPIRIAEVLTKAEKEKKKQMLMEKQASRIYRKKIEKLIIEKLENRRSILASEIPIITRQDFENLIYIRIFATDSKVYYVKKTDKRIKNEKCEFTDFEIFSKEKI